MPVTDTLTPLAVKTKNAGDVSVKIDQTTPGTTNGVQVNAALPAGTNIVGKVGIDQTTPGTTNGVQITGPGTSSGNPLYVNTGSSGVGTLKTSGQVATASPIAAGGSSTGNLASPLITSAKVGTLQHLILTASAPMKWDIQTVNASNVATTVLSFFTSGSDLNAEYKAVQSGEIPTVAGDGTNVKFNVVATNLDPTNAVTAYAFFVWLEN